MLRRLEEVTASLLEKCISRGMVFIITNAAEGWVEFSARKYIPKLASLLKHVTVISARSSYEDKYPGDSLKWKTLAFEQTMKNMELGAITNLIALGDSNIEMEASKKLAEKFPLALLKTVKFRVEPTPDELAKQLTLVDERFDMIYSSANNLNIRLERRENLNSNEENQPSNSRS